MQDLNLPKNTPIRIAKMINFVHDLADEKMKEIWDLFCFEMKSIEPYTGAEALTVIGTFCIAFTARMVMLMKMQIADQDDVGYTKHDIYKTIDDGIRRCLELVSEEAVRKDTASEIKRL